MQCNILNGLMFKYYHVPGLAQETLNWSCVSCVHPPFVTHTIFHNQVMILVTRLNVTIVSLVSATNQLWILTLAPVHSFRERYLPCIYFTVLPRNNTASACILASRVSVSVLPTSCLQLITAEHSCHNFSH